MKKKILVLGGTGFIGQNLIDCLIKNKNFSISSVSRNRFYKNKKIKHIKCDLTKASNLNKLTKENYDFVINLSGNIDHKDKKITNIIHNESCKNIFKLFSKKNIRLFIQAGSSLEYGNIQLPHKENLKCYPKSFYGRSKLKASQFIQKLGKKNNTKFIILRMYQVYGPKQKFDRLIPYTIKNCLLNKDFKCSSGEQLRDFLFIDDLIGLFVKIINSKKIKSGIYNVGYGKPIKVKKVIRKINNLVRKGNPLLGLIKMRSDESKISYPDIYKIKKNFKWVPKINILQGLKKTIKYYEKKY